MIRPVMPALWLLPLWLQGCLFACGNEEVGRSVSPGGEYVAAVFVRNCGATTDFSTHLAIVAAGEPAPEHGNIFVAQAGDAPRTEGGWLPVGLRWLGPKWLEVAYSAGAEEFLRVDRFRGIRIEYRVLAAANPASSTPAEPPEAAQPVMKQVREADAEHKAMDPFT